MAQQTITIHPILSRIRERGYWRMIIRPAQFEPGRIGDPRQLAPLVTYSATGFRGWEFPDRQPATTEEIGSDWVAHAVDSPYRAEYWRFYQSGQFLHYAAISEDWDAWSFRWQRHPAEGSITLLPVYDTLYRLTEIFEFAARLGLAREYNAGSSLRIELLLQPLASRQLYNDAAPSRTIHLTGIRPAHGGEFRRSLDIPVGELVTNTRALALQTAERLFDLFHWQATPGLLRRMQEEFAER